MMAGNQNKWNDQEDETLKKLWAEGLSAAVIGIRLGNRSRNSVIGRIHRLHAKPDSGIKLRESIAPKPKKPTVVLSKARVRPDVPKIITLPLKPPPPVKIQTAQGDGKITIMHLTDKTCRWPIGDPYDPEFCFCGHEPEQGSKYCPYHKGLSVDKSRPRPALRPPAPWGRG